MKIICDINKQMKLTTKKVLHIKYIKNNLTFIFEDNSNIKFDELNDLELY